MAHLAHSTAPKRAVKHVQFGVLSPEETAAFSVARMEHVETFERNRKKVGGLLDPRMGCVDKTDVCATCRSGTEGCPGHFGHIELARPMYHIGWQMTRVKKIIETVCYHCARLRMSPTETQVVKGSEPQTTKTEPRPKYSEMIKTKKAARFNFAWQYGKTRHACDWSDCGQGLMSLKKVRTKLQWSNGFGLEASDAYAILRRISDEDWSMLGMDPLNARPEWMILTVLPVPPPCVRPSINLEGNGRGEDDLTHKLSDIIKYNELVRNPPESGGSASAMRQAVDNLELLQFHITSYIDNEVRGNDAATQKGGRVLRSLKSRLKGKEGRMRNNLMGKRVNFSARTVITGDPYLRMDQVGVPQVIAENLTVPERANWLNMASLQRLVDNRGAYPGAKYIVNNGRRRDLRFGSTTPTVQLGDVVERHLVNDDVVVFNRQPSLHKMSMMGHKVRVMPYSTFRLNLSVTTPYNADFDGDEMNLHGPQGVATRAEIMNLAMVPDLIVSPQSNRPVCGIVQDDLAGTYWITGRNVFIDRATMMDLITQLPDADHLIVSIPVPAVVKPVPLWTGKQLFSMLLPGSLSYTGYHSAHPEDEHDDMSVGDTKVLIRQGELLCGIVCKRAIGPTGGGLIHLLWLDEGSAVVQTFMNRCQRLANQFLTHHGFSVGIGDGMINLAGMEQVVQTILAADQTADDNVTRDSAGKQARAALNRTNNFRHMVAAGSKGSSINISQIAACVGPQNVEGKGIPRGFRNRTLPHFREHDSSPSARGFVQNSYSSGLNPSEFFFHAMGGREGIIDTAVKSVTWETTIVVARDGQLARHVCIGEFVDELLASRAHGVEHRLEDANMELLRMPDAEFHIPTTDAYGNVTWGAISAVTRHDPGDVLYRIQTSSGRSVTVTAGKSLLVWDAAQCTFDEKPSTDVNAGDFVPVTAHLPDPPFPSTHIHMEPGASMPLHECNGKRIGRYLAAKESEAPPDRFSAFMRKHAGTGADRHVPAFAFTAPEEFVRGILGCVADSASTAMVREGIAMLWSRLGRFVPLEEGSDDYQRCNDVVLDRIVSIERISTDGHPKMYDLTVPSTNNFGLANGLHVYDTAETGYLQRKLIKALEDAKVTYDNLVRNGRGNVLQWSYGEDGMDGTTIEKQTLATITLTDHELATQFAGQDDDVELAQLIKDRDSLRKLDPLFNDTVALPTNPKRLLVQAAGRFPISPTDPAASNTRQTVGSLLDALAKHGLESDSVFACHIRAMFATRQLARQKISTRGLSWASDQILNKYARGKVHPGEMVGVVAAQSIGEPATQLTLNSVAYETELLLRVDGKLERHTMGKYIDDLVESQLERGQLEVHPGDTSLAWIRGKTVEILSSDDRGKVQWNRVEAATRHPVVNADGSDTLLKFTTQSGRTITATKAKSLLKRIDNRVQEADGDDFQVGDYLVVSGTLPGQSNAANLDITRYFPGFSDPILIEADETLGRLCGAFLVNASRTEPELEVFGKNKWCVKATLILARLFGVGDAKRIPADFLEMNDAFLRAFISGLVHGKGSNLAREHLICSPSKGLLQDVQQVLIRLGTRCNISENSAIFTLTEALDDADVIPDVITTQWGALSLSRRELSLLIPTTDGDRAVIHHALHEEDVYYDQIVSIETVSNDRPYVYDFTVENTQNFNTYTGICARDTFHLAGIGSKKLTLGIPRLKELLNTSQSINTPSMSLYPSNGDVDLRYLKSEIEHVSLEKLLEGVRIVHDPAFAKGTSTVAQDAKWVELFLAIPDETNPDWAEISPWMYRIVLDRARVWEHCLCMKAIVAAVRRVTEDLMWCIWSDDNDEELVIHCRMIDSTDDYPSANDRVSMETFLRQTLPMLSTGTTVKGIRGVTGVSMETRTVPRSLPGGGVEYVKETALETEGINLAEACALSDVDGTRVDCNNPVEILHFLGVEAARAVLLREIRKVIEFDGSYINVRHLMLLCDVMTTNGSLMAITRHGMNRTDAGPLAKSSFEETNEILFNAAADSDRDSMQGVSESLIFGQMANLGTGSFDVI